MRRKPDSGTLRGRGRPWDRPSTICGTRPLTTGCSGRPTRRTRRQATADPHPRRNGWCEQLARRLPSRRRTGDRPAAILAEVWSHRGERSPPIAARIPGALVGYRVPRPEVTLRVRAEPAIERPVHASLWLPPEHVTTIDAIPTTRWRGPCSTSPGSSPSAASRSLSTTRCPESCAPSARSTRCSSAWLDAAGRDRGDAGCSRTGERATSRRRRQLERQGPTAVRRPRRPIPLRGPAR